MPQLLGGVKMGQEQRGINFNSCPAIYWSDYAVA